MDIATPILGVDLSAIQGAVDWPQVAAAGVRFAWLKCTEGNEPRRNDRMFAMNVRGCKSVGIYVGAYHFCYPLLKGAGNTPEEQARRAYATSDALGTQAGELPPACDIEWPPHFEKGKGGTLIDLWAKWGVTAESIASWTLAYLAEAERLWGRSPILYTYPHFWRDLGAYGKVPAFMRYPLWIANYVHIHEVAPPPNARPLVPPPWVEWTVWQFSADGGKRLPGILTDIDRNVFRGDLDALRRLAQIDPDADTAPDLENAASQPTVHATTAMMEDLVAEFAEERRKKS